MNILVDYWTLVGVDHFLDTSDKLTALVDMIVIGVACW